MRMAYLVRKNGWMTEVERQVARRLGREWERQLTLGWSQLDGVSAAVFYAAACAVVVLERTGAQYVAALSAGREDAGVLFGVYQQAQGEARAAVRTAERLVQARGCGRVLGGEWLVKGGNAEDADRADGDGSGGGMDRIDRINRMEEEGEKREEAAMAEGAGVARAAGQPVSWGSGGGPATGWPAASGTQREAEEAVSPWGHLPRRERRWREREARKLEKKAGKRAA